MQPQETDKTILNKDKIKIGVHYHSPLADYEERTGKTLKEMVAESINKYLPTKYPKEKYPNNPKEKSL